MAKQSAYGRGAPRVASHMDVNAIVDGSSDAKVAGALQQGGGCNVNREMKAVDRRSAAAKNLYWILDTVEDETAWHPIGL